MAFYRREHLLQVPGLRERTPEEFVADKNFHLRDAPVAAADKVREDEDTVKMSNRLGDYLLPTPPPSRLNARGRSPLIPCPQRWWMTTLLSSPPTTKPS